MTSLAMSAEREAGKAAFAAFLGRRFAWGTDPKNPHKRGTQEHGEWADGYAAGLCKFFAQ